MTSEVKPLEPPPEGSPVELPPEKLSDRFKTWLLGPPLRTEQLPEERLGKPTALAVFASDNLSSAAYASEEILLVLVPAVGLAAFSLVLPITTAMLAVLAFLILSYRQTIKAYPTAGGAYMVTRDNFGILPAQVAGVALLIDYVLTVSVSMAAAAAAVTSAVSGLRSFAVPIAALFIAVVGWGNLRGVKQSGKIFSVPTYFFLLNMAVLLSWGIARVVFGGGLPQEALDRPGLVHAGDPGQGLFLGASLYVMAHAFASGGAAVTGVEAISNGVSAFREPQWKNARTTLVIMCSCLAVMFVGLSSLAAKLHVAPFEEGSPTVISEVGRIVFGGGVGRVLYYSLQVATTLILIMAANTSFADFPRLANFHATDHFMPHQLVKRGHRLVFSNGIIFLAIAAAVMVGVTGAEVDRLIPLYAIGVFTSFTFSQAGMAKHHLREKEEGWRRGLWINGVGAVLSFVVLLCLVITKFTHGAWVVVLVVPVMVWFLVRLARRYESEEEELEENVQELLEGPELGRHVVFVLVDRLDPAVLRAVEYARRIGPAELRALHFVLDEDRAEKLSERWESLGLEEIPLELIECPDRKVTNCALTTVGHALADGETMVTILVPDRVYGGAWERLLHDETAHDLARELTRLPHAHVTTVPFHLDV